MKTISWNLVEERAVEFAAKWRGETYEKGESQSFWSDFLRVFGVDRKRHGAFFEYAIKKNGGKQGFIDMFWPGKLLAEQKSLGRDLTKAQIQAREYLHTMPDHDLPEGVIVSDFANFEYIDLNTDEITTFKLEDLPKHVKLFGYLVGLESRKLAEQDPVSRQAAEAMAELHNALRDTGYTGHDLELLLVRLVFCLFADDSGIFERGSFESFVRNRTDIDGSDLGPRLVKLFEVLNTRPENRSTTLDASLKDFEYINGGLFAEQLSIPDFNYRMRDILLAAMGLDWSKVSPAIFGSMFQGVMDAGQRRNLGAHYTSEENILKVIKPLFLDDLYDEFARIGSNGTKLRAFHDKIASLKFLDPACGCGNFLVITYRELRKLEHKILEKIYGKQRGMFDVGAAGLIQLNVDQMYGIEIEEFPALIAQTALWLTDHQMNMEFSAESGRVFKRIPLTKSAAIIHGNALTLDWAEIIAPADLCYILGNPPFIGSKMMTPTMRAELLEQFPGVNGAGVLDFVTAWYAKASAFMEKNKVVRAALVSTNSITQGEQVPILWKHLFEKGVHINFAHQTFKWSNDARSNAGVHCVIIGFSFNQTPVRRLFTYKTVKDEPIEQSAGNINGYLINADSVFIENRTKPICDVPPMVSGNKPIDNGEYLFTSEQKNVFIAKEPNSKRYFKRWLGGSEFINNIERWFLFTRDIDLATLRKMPLVMERIENVRKYRADSKSIPTQKLADFPREFHTTFNSQSTYIALPEVSSEKRKYIPISILDGRFLCGNKLRLIDNANLYHFGILNSSMHMAWMRAVAGRLESRYQYSKNIVYNNFVWPEINEVEQSEIEKLSQMVLDARAQFPDASFADLYDPLSMPPVLAKAHKALDRYVDRLYRKEGFATDADRVSHLFTLYREKN